MSNRVSWIRKLCLAAVPAVAFVSVSASIADEAGTLRIGQSGEFSGQGVAKENALGAQLYFDSVNKRGGVNGKQIALISLDDARDSERTIANTKKLINEHKVLALFGYRSTPSVEAVVPLIQAEGVPLIAPFTGAQSIRGPKAKMVYHLRASYQTEAMRIVEHLASSSIKKIAILYQEDSFGEDALAGFQASLKARGLQPVAVASYDRKTMDLKPAAAKLVKAEPQVIAMACTPKACAQFVRMLKKDNVGVSFVTLSNTTTDEFLKAIDKEGRGVIISQVVPYPWNPISPVVKEFQQLLPTAKEPVPLSYASLEGFVAAKLMVEAIRRAGREPTRANLVAALDSLPEIDLGGMTVDYKKNGTGDGSRFVDITMIGKDGTIIH
ncbi:ABC transporter substrate-binding protein [Propionivibrio soli]|uniref:ABC transporter substrate-binding protein n=1 Tax=Propionivibrio soli TaxID=2976531 RepID=UPI0021E7209B|nr:ABC transporter substrate-binding protein [Propionivibrio soli]